MIAVPQTMSKRVCAPVNRDYYKRSLGTLHQFALERDNKSARAHWSNTEQNRSLTHHHKHHTDTNKFWLTHTVRSTVVPDLYTGAPSKLTVSIRRCRCCVFKNT